MKSKLKKSLSLLLALVMVLSCMSVGAFATDDGVIDTEEELTAAVAAVAAGGTVTLGGNVTLTSPLRINKALTLDLDGNTITEGGAAWSDRDGLIVIENTAGTVTIENGTLTPTRVTNSDTGSALSATVSVKSSGDSVSISNVAMTTAVQGIRIVSNSAPVTISNTTLTLGTGGTTGVTHSGIFNDSSSTGAVTIESGTYTGLYNVVHNGSGSTVNISGGTFGCSNAALGGEGTFSLTGGTFSGDSKGDTSYAYLQDKVAVDYAIYEVVDSNRGTVYTVRSASGKAAQIGSTQYDTLQQAIDAVEDGQTIELLRNIEIEAPVVLTKSVDVSYTIDGNKYSISPKTGVTIENDVFYAGGGGITLKNITISGFTTNLAAADKSNAIIRGSANLVLNNCTFTSNTTTGSIDSDNTAIITKTGGILTITGCTFSYNVSVRVIQTSGSTTLNITNSLFDHNDLSGAGVILVTTAASSGNAITGNTFRENITHQPVGRVGYTNTAVLYLSNPVQTVSNNLFVDNTITNEGKKAGNLKEGVIVLGSGAGGSNITGNAFDGNTLGDTVEHYATVYTGTNNATTLSNNYWDGKNTADIYDTKGTATNSGIAMYYTAGTTGATVSNEPIATYVGYVKSLGANVGNTIYLNVKMVFPNKQDGMRLKYQIGNLAPTYFSLPTPDANGVYLFQIPVIAKYFGVQGTISLVDATDETVYDISKGESGTHVTSVQYSVYDYLDLLEASNVRDTWLDLSTAIRNLGNMTAKHWEDNHNASMANQPWIAYPAN